MNKALVAGVVCVISLGVTSPVPAQAVPAQSVLDRLEQRIRDRADGPADEAEPADPAGDAGKGAPADRPQGYLGVVADDSEDRGRGVRILEIHAGSPAAKAGLRPKDLVTGLADIRIRQMADMADVLELYAPGDSLLFEVLRNGQTSKIKVTMGRRPAAQADPPPPADPPPADDARVEQLQRRIEQLERRVAELERLVGELSKK